MVVSWQVSPIMITRPDLTEHRLSTPTYSFLLPLGTQLPLNTHGNLTEYTHTAQSPQPYGEL